MLSISGSNPSRFFGFSAGGTRLGSRCRNSTLSVSYADKPATTSSLELVQNNLILETRALRAKVVAIVDESVERELGHGGGGKTRRGATVLTVSRTRLRQAATVQVSRARRSMGDSPRGRALSNRTQRHVQTRLRSHSPLLSSIPSLLSPLLLSSHHVGRRPQQNPQPKGAVRTIPWSLSRHRRR